MKLKGKPYTNDTERARYVRIVLKSEDENEYTYVGYNVMMIDGFVRELLPFGGEKGEVAIGFMVWPHESYIINGTSSHIVKWEELCLNI